jgi:hypothetical protein
VPAGLESIGRLVRQRARRLLQVYRGRLDAYAVAYRANVTTAVSRAIGVYRKYIGRVLAGDWFAFPRRLFNDTAGGLPGRLPSLVAADDLLGVEADFGAFLELEEVENVQMWSVQFWER